MRNSVWCGHSSNSKVACCACQQARMTGILVGSIENCSQTFVLSVNVERKNSYRVLPDKSCLYQAIVYCYCLIYYSTPCLHTMSTWMLMCVPLSGVVSFAAGCYHTCAVLSGGAVNCWGYNGYGQLGQGSTTNRYSPTAVSGLGSGVWFFSTCI